MSRNEAAPASKQPHGLRGVSQPSSAPPPSPCHPEFLARRRETASSFSAAVEACVLHGLKRRAAGFLRSNKIAALFMKVGKSFPPAEELSRKVQDLEQLIENA